MPCPSALTSPNRVTGVALIRSAYSGCVLYGVMPIAPARSASGRFASVRYALRRFALVRFALVRFAPARYAPVRSAPRRSIFSLVALRQVFHSLTDRRSMSYWDWFISFPLWVGAPWLVLVAHWHDECDGV